MLSDRPGRPGGTFRALTGRQRAKRFVLLRQGDEDPRSKGKLRHRRYMAEEQCESKRERAGIVQVLSEMREPARWYLL